MSKEIYTHRNYTIKIGDIIDLNFKKLNDAKNFATGYNRGTRARDFEYDDFDSEMERRGFDFSIKVWSMLRIHAEEDKFKKSKAVIMGLPRRFKSHVSDEVFSQT